MTAPASPAAVACARALRGEGLEPAAIAAKTGLSLRQLGYWLRPDAGTPRPTARRACKGRKRPARKAARPPSPAARLRMMGRLWTAAEAQMAEIEARLQRLAEGEGSARDGVQDARALAILARVMRDLSALDAAARKARAEAAPPAGAAPLSPEGPGAFRAELARRLAGLCDSVQPPAPDTPPEGTAPLSQG